MEKKQVRQANVFSGLPIWLVCSLTVIGIGQAQTPVEHVIHTFGNFPKGAMPYGTLIRDAAGNLYGTTYEGGAAALGVVYRVNSSGYKVLYSFQGGTDGANPYAGVTLDSTGNLYGTTYYGGAANAGVVFKVDPSGQETVLYSFKSGSDGANPTAGVIFDSAGNLYGTTYNGGTAGKGTVYKLNPSGQETVLHSFTGDPDGANPYAGVVADPSGNLYGTTYAGGGAENFGVIYKVDPSGQETPLYSFATYGTRPYAGLIRDAAGNLYGTTSGFRGNIYRLDPAGKYTVLYELPSNFGSESLDSGLTRDAAGNLYGTASFGGINGAGEVYKLTPSGNYKQLNALPAKLTYWIYTNAPVAGVVLDAAGNVYGTTSYSGLAGIVYRVSKSGQETTLYSFPAAAGGTIPVWVTISQAGGLYGTTSQGGTANAGAVYKMDTTGKETVLYSFTGGADGAGPTGRVAVDSAGNVYGTTSVGGGANFGVVYKVDPSGRQTVLHSFTGGADGANPAAVILDSAGNLYGATLNGGAASQTGAQEGVVFKLDPSGNETVLYSFTGLSDGGGPYAGVVRDQAGNLYGTTFYGGRGAGVIFKLDTAGHETVLYSFIGGADGGNPLAGVIRDPGGNLYGTTANGSPGSVLYRLDAAGHYTVLYAFTGGVDGGQDNTGVVRDPAGNLYGAAAYGGAPGCNGNGCGVVFELDTAGSYTVLHTFTGGADGGAPESVVVDNAGSLYGTTGLSVTGGGVFYKLTLQ